ncbi:uncharacterized protein [Arachis hypogaea]|uniref:uncharacterized protein n=1 Tax=Arachis hypogaea TaxID=3818 RepID=UPI003B216373
MPFGLKNAGVTYQRLMNKVFANHIGKMMEVYVDDMLVKTQREETLLSDLTEVFNTMRKHWIRLNPAKYTFAVEAALLAGLKLARQVRDQKLTIFSDSQVVTSQIEGSYQTEDHTMKKYLDKTREQLRQIRGCKVRHIPREQNGRADALSKLASTKPGGNNRNLIQETLQNPSISEEKKILTISGQNQGWMTPIVNYLKFETFPTDKKEAKRLVREAQYYTIVDDILYKREISTPLLKCVPTSATRDVLEEVHGGMCGNHFRAKALAKKVL